MSDSKDRSKITCFYCGCEIDDIDNSDEKSFGIAHAECSESEDPEEID